MSVTFVGAITVAELFPNIDKLVNDVLALVSAYGSFKASMASLDGVLDVLVTLEGGLDFVLNASFGLIPLKLLVMLEFQGALRAMAGLTIAISNPLAQAVASISAMSAALVSLQASLSLGLPTVSADLNLQLSVMAAVSAAAAAKLAGITAVIEAVGSLLGPLNNAKLLILQLKAALAPLDVAFNLLPLSAFVSHLGGTGAYLYTASCPIPALGTELATQFATLPPGIPATSTVKAVMVLVDYTSKPVLWGDVSFMMRTTP